MLKVKVRINYLGFDEVLFKVYIEYMIILSLLVLDEFSRQICCIVNAEHILAAWVSPASVCNPFNRFFKY